MENLVIDEMRLLARLRNVDGYENMSGQHLKRSFTTLSASAFTTKLKKEICF